MGTIDNTTLVEHLIRGRNADGGWGYYRGKSSRLESTSWAALALARRGGTDATEALRLWPAQDGVLLEHPGGLPNYAFHGLALLVLSACNVSHRDGNDVLVSALQQAKGIALGAPSGGRQDNSLQAWSWIPNTFSWVEPTSWCLLCLKKRRGRSPSGLADARISEAERLLINRACITGGWNYGNPDVLGRDLHPYVPTTALGVLAMQDRQDDEMVTRSIDFLEAHATSEPSASALALALLALQACMRDTARVGERLVDQLPTTLELGNHAAIAMALVALNTEPRIDAFSL